MIQEECAFLFTGQVRLRVATRTDLPRLEWFGQYRHYRTLFWRVYQEQIRGKRIMLLAAYNNFPIGRVFVQFKSADKRLADGSTRAYLYSFQVMEMFRGQGIGTWLMTEAESMLRHRHFEWVTIAVAKNNTDALRLYNRLNYHKFADDSGKWSYTDHRGNEIYVSEPCWILKKRLNIR